MKVLSNQITAKISEVFSSIQGEGIYAGEGQIFVRFQGCNMKCVYCDTPSEGISQEVTVGSVMNKVLSLNADKLIRTVSLTGGEPLLYANFLKVLIPELRGQGYKIYLETNGTLPEKLTQVISLVDVVAMDIKLSSSTNDRPFWDEHRDFLLIAQSQDLFVKVVITGRTDEGEFYKAIELIEDIDRDIPLVLQPATQFKDFNAVPEVSVLFKWQKAARSKLKNVRIIPQIHKIWGLR